VLNDLGLECSLPKSDVIETNDSTILIMFILQSESVNVTIPL